MGCGLRLTAVQMPITRESQVVGFFSVSEAADAVSREVECLLTWPIVSCSLDDQYVQYSAKRGLQCGLRTPQLFGLGKGV